MSNPNKKSAERVLQSLHSRKPELAIEVVITMARSFGFHLIRSSPSDSSRVITLEDALEKISLEEAVKLFDNYCDKKDGELLKLMPGLAVPVPPYAELPGNVVGVDRAPGRLVVLHGSQGVGKSTVGPLIVQSLESKGKTALYKKEAFFYDGEFKEAREQARYEFRKNEQKGQLEVATLLSLARRRALTHIWSKLYSFDYVITNRNAYDSVAYHLAASMIGDDPHNMIKGKFPGLRYAIEQQGGCFCEGEHIFLMAPLEVAYERASSRITRVGEEGTIDKNHLDRLIKAYEIMINHVHGLVLPTQKFPPAEIAGEITTYLLAKK